MTGVFIKRGGVVVTHRGEVVCDRERVTSYRIRRGTSGEADATARPPVIGSPVVSVPSCVLGHFQPDTTGYHSAWERPVALLDGSSS